MKKKIAAVLLLSTLIAGTVSASTINGDYKGNPIVKVRANGVLVDSDVPAQIIDGSTLLPLRAVANAVGAELIWNQDTYSVDLKTNVSSIASSNVEDIKKIKLLSKISNHYHRVSNLGQLLTGVGTNFSLTYEAISRNYNASSSVNNSLERLNKTIDNYNAFIQPNNEMITEAHNSGIELYDLKGHMDNFNKSIDYLKKSYEGLESFYITKSGSDFDTYLNNLKQADILINNVIILSDEKYFDYYVKVQKY